MAEKVKSKSGAPNPNMLIAGLVFIAAGVGWSVYEVTRARTPEEVKEMAEQAKIQQDIDRANKKRAPGP